jgi:AAA domain
VKNSDNIVALGKGGRGEDRFTSRDMIAVEERLHQASRRLAERELHKVSDCEKARAIASAEARGLALSGEQRAAFNHATSPKDLGIVIGYAGTGKSAMLGVAREAWEGSGFQVRGLALSGIAAENLEAGSAIASRTIASVEHQWTQGRELLTSHDVLVIDEAGMIGSRQMERVLSAAEKAGAKVVLVGDPQQLQAIEAGAAFRSVAERHGGVEITEIRRQQIDWQRDATRHLATERTAEALQAYTEHDMVHVADTREVARAEMVNGWERARLNYPDQSQIILTHTNDEVQNLNQLARGRLRDAGDLGEDVTVKAERGDRQFASGDRLMFLRNDRELGVKNGTLGKVEQASPTRMTVKLDDGRSVAFDTKNYAHVDHGYAATIHKAQGVTVDRTHVLATPGLDRHASYVALSRHRKGVQLHYGRDDFADAGKLARTLSRERSKDMASDYSRDADMERRFAERRGIRFRERVTEIIRKMVPEKAQSIFANFRPAPELQRDSIVEHKPKAGSLDIGRGVERYARAIEGIERTAGRGLEPMPHQLAARDKAFAALNDILPKAGTTCQPRSATSPNLSAKPPAGAPPALSARCSSKLKSEPIPRCAPTASSRAGSDCFASALRPSKSDTTAVPPRPPPKWGPWPKNWNATRRSIPCCAIARSSLAFTPEDRVGSAISFRNILASVVGAALASACKGDEQWKRNGSTPAAMMRHGRLTKSATDWRV